MSTDNTTQPPQKPGILREILSWVFVLVIAAAIALFIRNVVIVNAVVPTGSMLNTIPEHSRLVAFRLSYTFSDPSRGDVVVFRFPDDESVLHVKRIIGLPEETVNIIGGLVYIDNATEPLDEWYLMETPIPQNMTFEVPAGHFFVMGDNRNFSLDSRSWQTTSYLPQENILGRAIFRYWPRVGLIR